MKGSTALERRFREWAIDAAQSVKPPDAADLDAALHGGTISPSPVSTPLFGSLRRAMELENGAAERLMAEAGESDDVVSLVAAQTMDLVNDDVREALRLADLAAQRGIPEAERLASHLRRRLTGHPMTSSDATDHYAQHLANHVLVAYRRATPRSTEN
jgi:hypothetical protein